MSLEFFYDLITPDGTIELIEKKTSTKINVEVLIQKIPSHFKGFSIDHKLIQFNFKSTLAQIGVEATLKHLDLNEQKKRALISLELSALGD